MLFRILTLSFICISLSACMTKYRSSQVNLEPSWVTKETISWCVEAKCPNYVKSDLLGCQVNAVKQDYRNNLDDSIVKEDIGDKLISISMAVWDWVF